MKDFIIQFGIAIIMAILLVITILAIVVTWLGIVIYSFFSWLAEHDGSSHKPYVPSNIKSKYIETSLALKPSISDAEFESLFAPKVFPKPYTPDNNPLYILQGDWEDWKKKHPFDKKMIFDEVDASDIRMTKKQRHTFRDITNGRFKKREPLPITRYGQPKIERFKTN